MSSEQETLSLSKAAQYLLEECRMVLPGMQALFGFQLISVFSDSFDKKLSQPERYLHLLALALVASGIALVMTPAAIHRRSGPQKISQQFIESSTRLLLWSMFPLSFGICLDFFLIARIITGSTPISILLALFIYGFFVFFWFVFPKIHKRSTD